MLETNRKSCLVITCHGDLHVVHVAYKVYIFVQVKKSMPSGSRHFQRLAHHPRFYVPLYY